MIRVKFCGLSRPCDIKAANALRPDYIGFVMARGSRRYVTPDTAAALKAALSPAIPAVGVFVDEDPALIAELLRRRVIDVAQLHGGEDGAYIRCLRALCGAPVWQAFRVASPADVARAAASSADCVLLDAGAGEGKAFDWGLLQGFPRPFFLAGGLDAAAVPKACRLAGVCGLDVSSGIETDGIKDPKKMAAFLAALRKEEAL